MRPDTESWLRQARHDLQVAEKNLSLQLYDVVLVYCQQAVEKALKGLYIEQTGNLPPRTHSLDKLSDITDSLTTSRQALLILEDYYFRLRYPSAGDSEPPYLGVGEVEAMDGLTLAREAKMRLRMSLKLNLKMLPEKAKRKVERVNEAIGSVVDELYAPDALILFGSYAHGQPDEWSDVDLLIVSNAFRTIPKLRRRSQFLINTGAYLHSGLHIEPLCLTPDEFLYGIQWATIEREALETGFVLLDRTGVTQEREAA